MSTPLPKVPLQMDLSFLLILIIIIFIGLFFMQKKRKRVGKKTVKRRK